MSIGDLYTIVAANFGGVLVLLIALWYLAATDRVIGGHRYVEMRDDRDYWRTAYLDTMGEIHGRLDRIAEPDEVTP